jgi:hypothetical protein
MEKPTTQAEKDAAFREYVQSFIEDGEREVSAKKSSGARASGRDGPLSRKHHAGWGASRVCYASQVPTV